MKNINQKLLLTVFLILGILAIPRLVFSAPSNTIFRNLLPEQANLYNIGATSTLWNVLHTYGINLNGDFRTSWPTSGISGNPFNQWLDSTSTVQFKTITVSSTAEFSDSVVRKSSITDTLLGSSGFLYYSGKYIYQSGLGSDTLTIFSVNDPENPKKVGQLTNGTLFDAIEKVVLVGKYLYVVAMNSNSFVVVDVSDVTKPKIVSSIVDATLLNGAEFVTISGRYAYVGVTTGDRVTIIDIADPINPKIVGSVYDATNLNAVIYIAVSGKYLYATASNGGRLAIVDASDVTNPRVVGAVATGAGAGTVAVRGRYAYVSGYGNPTFHILDISSSTNPTLVNTLTNAANFDDMALTVKLSGKYAFMTIYGGTPGIAMIDITSSSTMPTLAYKLTDANFSGLDDLTIVGGYIYATDNSGKKLHIIKIPGVVSPSIETGNIYTDKLNVDGEAILDGVLQVKDGITTGGGLFSMGSITSNSSIYSSTTLAVATTTPWAGYQLVVNGNSLTTGNATTTGTVDASQYCISGGNCISAWPAGGGGSGDGVWVITANGIYNATNTDTVVLGTNTITDVANTLEVTGDSYFSGDIVVGGYATTTLGLFTQGSGHFGGNLTVDGSATTSGHLAALGGNSDQWNTAYSWGDHSGAGYLTSALAATTYLSLSSWYGTTTDGLPEGVNNLYYTDARSGDYIDASTTIQTLFANSATAYGWGNHATAGYLSLTNWFATTTWAGGGDLLVKKNATTTGSMAIGSLLNCDTIDTDANGLLKCGTDGGGTGTGGNPFDQWLDTTSTPTFHSATTTHNFFAGGYASTSLGFFTQGNLWIGGNATTSHLAASEICLNGDCKTAWPTGGTGGGNPFNQWLDTTSTPTFLSVTTTNFYVGTQIRVATSTADSTYDLAVQGNALFSGNIVVGGTLTVNAISVVSMNDEVILSTADAIFSTSTPDGLNHRPVGYDTSGFNKWLVFYGAVDNDISWDFIYPSKCASTSNAYLDIFITATSTYGDAVFKAFLWKQDSGDLVDSASSYDSPNIATTTFPTTARSLKKLTIPLTNRDYFYGGATGRLMLQLSGSSTTTDSYLFVKEKARFYCE